MVMIIGLVTMTALIWVLAYSMAGESESEKRRGMSEMREALKEAA